ncbi:MAG TPA: glycoside hydrolase family protein [Candidatus Gallacutalibacter stercoravium]|nr:glycoside hydrolase family protein [Candidatus Gallacutalibacter stercoravium]
MSNPFAGRLLPAPVNGGFQMEDYWIWCGSVVKGEDGRFHMFASRWPKKYGFAANWLYRCEIVRASSDTPEGPYQFEEVVLGPRGRQYFDGMNVHNPYIRHWRGKYYLYYMGATYAGPAPQPGESFSEVRVNEVWNRKRIGLAVADSAFGPWKRLDEPLLQPRDCSHWDCTVTTNPAVAILEDGTSYLLYKSRSYAAATLQIGVARAKSPEGPFERLSEEPILSFSNPDFHVEDPYLWYEDGLFRLIIKDDFKNGCGGITGHWGAGFFATSRDCIHWEIGPDPLVYTRRIQWDDGSVTEQCNAERPFLLLQEGKPTHLFLATGRGKGPYDFDRTWNMVIPLR